MHTMGLIARVSPHALLDMPDAGHVESIQVNFTWHGHPLRNKLKGRDIMVIMRTAVPLALWWSERLHNLTKRRQGFAGGRVFRQCRIACGAVEMRMRFAGKAEHAGDRDVGMADALAE